MNFGRRKRATDSAGGGTGTDPVEDAAATDDEFVDEFVDDLDEEDRAYEDALLVAELDAKETEQAGPVPLQRPQGPWDAEDAPAGEVARVDLGGLLVPVPDQTEVRLDVTEQGEVYAATMVQGTSAVQVNAFAAPRTEGIWGEVLAEIAESLTSTGGRVEHLTGPYGPELRADVPTQLPGQSGVTMAPARFVGVDGPRWFLRAMYTGPAAVDPTAAGPLELALRDVVVVRGTDPMAVRDALPLRLPVDATQAPDPDDVDDDEEGDDDDPLRLAERGPEITEIR